MISMGGLDLKYANSLIRVLSISTLCFHKPLKSRLSGLVFADNCLNILTLAYLRPFFRLLKNCTKIRTIRPLNLALFYHTTFCTSR